MVLGSWYLFHLTSPLLGIDGFYTLKVGLDGKIDGFKAHMVAKGYTQVFGHFLSIESTSLVLIMTNY